MQKFLYALLSLLFLQFSVVYSQDWEPVCEQEICVQSFYDTGTNDINDITNVYAEGFLLRTPGTSGENTDYAAWSNNTTASFILFSHTGLSAAYEYRVRIYAKSPHVGKEVDFGYVYGNDLSTFQPISSDHSVVQVGSFSSPGAEVISEIFAVSEIGNLNIAILPRGTATTQLDKVMIDDYVLERRVLASPTSVYFSLSNASINEGEAFDICLSIENPSNENNTRVEVSLLSLQPPLHFTDLVIPEIIFPAGSSEDVCFTVTPAVLEMEGTYNFVISSVGGDHNPIIGDGNQHELKVLPEIVAEECEWSGSTLTICPGGEVQIGCLEEDIYCYRWLPDETLDDPFSLHPIASPLETTVYTLYVTDENGNLLELHEALVTVDQGVELIVTPENPTICEVGGSVQLSADAFGEDEDFSFSWSTSETTTSINVASPGTYGVTVTNNLSGCSSEEEIVVTATEEQLMIIGETNEICPGQVIELSSSLLGEEYTYEWSTGESTSTIEATEAELYSLTVTSSENSCWFLGEFSITESTTTVEVLPENPVVCPGKTVELSVDGTYTSYEWIWANETYNTATLQFPYEWLATSPEVTLSVTDERGCTASATISVSDGLDPAAILDWLEGKGFYGIDISVIDDDVFQQGATNSRSTVELCDQFICTDANNPAPCVEDNANLQFEINGELVTDLQTELYTNLEYFAAVYGYQASRAYISKNENWCACTEEDYQVKVESFFENAEQVYWVHIYDAPDTEQDRLFILGNMPTMSSPEAGYFPNVDNRRDRVDFAIDAISEDEGDGNTGSEAQQTIFVLQDILLDNYLDADLFGLGIPAEEEEGNTGEIELPICSDAYMNGMIGISPAGIPMALPDAVVARFVPHREYSNFSPAGALTGFTDLTFADQGTNSYHYYHARTSYDEADGLPRFEGYFRQNIRRGEAPNDTWQYTSFQPDEPTIVTLGILDPVPPETPTTVQLLENVFNFNNVFPPISYDPVNGSTGAGDFIVGGFPDDWMDLISGAYQLEFIDVADILEITATNSTQEIQDGIEAVVYEATLTDGNTAYVLATIVNGVLEVYQWNCYTAEAEPLADEGLALNIRAQMEADACVVVEDSSDPERELGDPFCFYLTPEQAGPRDLIEPASDLENVGDVNGVFNYSNGGATEFEAAIQTAFDRYGIKLKFVISADAGTVTPFAPDDPDSFTGTGGGNLLTMNGGPADHFYGEELSSANSSKTDAIFWVHYKEDGSVGYCLRLAEDFFTHTESTLVDNMTAEEEGQYLASAAQLEETLIEQFRTGFSLIPTPEEIRDDVGSEQADEECGEDCSDTNAETPWWFGRRKENTQAINYLNISTEMVGLGKAFMKQLSIPKKLGEGSDDPNLTMFEIPEVLLGGADAIVQENPFVGMAQLGTLAWSFVENKQTRDAIIDAVLNLRKTAQAIYKEKKTIYTDPTSSKELLLFTAGQDGTTVVMAIWFGGGYILNKLKDLGKKAKGAAQKLKRGFDNHPDGLDVDNPFFRQFNDPGISELDVRKFHEFFGEGGDQLKKVAVRAPYLLQVWKSFDNIDGVDLKAIMQKMPDPDASPAYYTQLEAKFFETRTHPDNPDLTFEAVADPDKMKKFLEDVTAEPQVHDKIIGNPEFGFDAWEGLEGSDVLRRNGEVIEESIEFLISGFSKTDLEKVASISNRTNVRYANANLPTTLTIDELMRLAAKNVLISTKNCKLQQFDQLLGAPNINIHETLDDLLASPAYQASWFEFKHLTDQLRSSSGDNIGFVEQLNEGHRIFSVEGGGPVRIEAKDGVPGQSGSNPRDIGDVVDDTPGDGKVLQLKSSISIKEKKIRTLLGQAVRQAVTELSPVGYTKVAEVRIRNADNPMISWDVEQLRSYLEAGYDALPEAQRVDYHQVDVLRIRFGGVDQPTFEFKVNDAGDFVDL